MPDPNGPESVSTTMSNMLYASMFPLEFQTDNYLLNFRLKLWPINYLLNFRLKLWPINYLLNSSINYLPKVLAQNSSINYLPKVLSRNCISDHVSVCLSVLAALATPLYLYYSLLFSYIFILFIFQRERKKEYIRENI